MWKLYLKGDEYYMEWLGVDMLMMSTHQLTDSLYANSMKYQQYRVCIERINDSLFACSFYQDIPTKWLLLRMYYDKDYNLTAIQREEAFVDYECEREFKVLFLKSFTIAARRSNLCIETITAQVNAIRRVI